MIKEIAIAAGLACTAHADDMRTYIRNMASGETTVTTMSADGQPLRIKALNFGRQDVEAAQLMGKRLADHHYSGEQALQMAQSEAITRYPNADDFQKHFVEEAHIGYYVEKRGISR